MTERVVQVAGTDLFVTFDPLFDQVWIQRGVLSEERGDAIRLTHDEWSLLVDQARQLRGRARPR